MYPALSVSPSLRLTAPGRPKPLDGISMAHSIGGSGDSAGGSGDSGSSGGGGGSGDSPRSAYECTLIPGCTLGVNHPGICNSVCREEQRSPCRPNYCSLAGRKRTREPAPPPPPPQQQLGLGTSRYYPSWLSSVQHSTLLAFCRDEVRYQHYLAVQRPYGLQPRYKAPKAEYYVVCADGRRPIYKWTQGVDFYPAGQPMPPILLGILNRLNDEFHLAGSERLNHCLIIINEQSGNGKDAHQAPPHADKHRTGRFFDISLGYAREFQLLTKDDNQVVASQRLESGSLAAISVEDNGHGPRCEDGKYLHSVPPDFHQPADQPRFSIVFRAITDHPDGKRTGEHFADLNPAAAARVQPGGDLWDEYVPLYRRQG